jgi:S1-C subfamily serine protease
MSPAMEAGFIKDDIILSINGNKIIDHIDFVKRVKEYSPTQGLKCQKTKKAKTLKDIKSNSSLSSH